MAILIQTEKAAAWQQAISMRFPNRKVVTCIHEVPKETIAYLLTWPEITCDLRLLPGLRAVFALGAGVERILAKNQIPREMPLVRLADGGMSPLMRDYLLYAVLHFHRQFNRYRQQQQNGDWTPLPMLAKANGPVGILGLGMLGLPFARCLTDLGFSVLGWSRSAKRINGIQWFSGHSQLPAFLSHCAILVCLLPLTDVTRGLLNRDRLAMLPKGAAIINASRGAILDENALLEALAANHLQGAFLDVTAEEPLPPSHPFWQHPRIEITPHIAAPTPIIQAAQTIAEAINTLEQGDRPAGLVNREMGY